MRPWFPDSLEGSLEPRRPDGQDPRTASRVNPIRSTATSDFHWRNCSATHRRLALGIDEAVESSSYPSPHLASIVFHQRHRHGLETGFVVMFEQSGHKARDGMVPESAEM